MYQNELSNNSVISTNHIICWSGGKDSTATVILFHEHEKELLKPGDKVTILFVEVMYDLKRNISGHNPDIIDFIYEKKKIFESWGYNVEILRSKDKDFLTNFYHKLTRSPDPERVGKTYGFVSSSSICAIRKDCKLKPMNEWNKLHANDNQVQYVGIALDEPKRLESLHKQPDRASLLEKYGYTEDMAMELCRKYDMVSPQYFLPGNQMRDGCWFCPNCKFFESKNIYERMPDIWEEYVALEDTPNLAYPKWNCYSKETLKERDLRVKGLYKQYSIFDYITQ
ncbi:MAG: hypothetical protein K6B67_05490 [Lachnospiraceae bacterium]|nr:hypothetical protein [Lachnospiraceae bacterium]